MAFSVFVTRKTLVKQVSGGVIRYGMRVSMVGKGGHDGNQSTLVTKMRQDHLDAHKIEMDKEERHGNP